MNLDNINSFFDHIYVITLERDIQRQEHIIKSLEGLTFSFFYGIDKKALVLDELIEEGIYNEDRAIENHRYDKPMNTGQIGCSWSHRLVYEDMVQNNYRRVIVIEDDAIPNKEGMELLEERITKLPAGWELMYLDCDTNLKRNIGTFFTQLFMHIRHIFGKLKYTHTMINNTYARKHSDNILRAGRHGCSNAYAITQSAAKKLIQLQTPIVFPSNELLAHATTNNVIQAFVFQPNVFKKNVALKAKTLVG